MTIHFKSLQEYVSNFKKLTLFTNYSNNLIGFNQTKLHQEAPRVEFHSLK